MYAVWATGWDHAEGMPACGPMRDLGGPYEADEIPGVIRRAYYDAIRDGWGFGAVYVTDQNGILINGGAEWLRMAISSRN